MIMSSNMPHVSVGSCGWPAPRVRYSAGGLQREGKVNLHEVISSIRFCVIVCSKIICAQGPPRSNFRMSKHVLVRLSKCR